jgi:hypothetical protein
VEMIPPKDADRAHRPRPGENGSAKVYHGSGRIVLLRAK